MCIIRKSNKYTGVGSRSTPIDQQNVLTDIAKKLDFYNYTLRSGHADGADLAFEKGTKEKEIYVPWKNFNGFRGDPPKFTDTLYEFTVIEFLKHKKGSIDFNEIREPVQKLMMRNVFQVIGKDIKNPEPSDFLIYWAEEENGEVLGGTGFAVHIAKKFNVPVYNISTVEGLKKTKQLLTYIKYNYLLSVYKFLLLFYYDDIKDETSKEILDMFENHDIIKVHDGENIFAIQPYLNKDIMNLLQYLYKTNKKMVKHEQKCFFERY